VNQEDWDSKALALISQAKGDAGAARESLTRHLVQVEAAQCGMLVAERSRVLEILNQTAGTTA
jgi:hypothetical protein